MTDIAWPTPAEWANELRTTDRGQIVGSLVDDADTCNCALGILVRMAGATHLKPFDTNDLDGAYELAGELLDGFLSGVERPDWLNVSHVTELNDQQLWTFAEIATWIEAGMPANVVENLERISAAGAEAAA